MKFLQNIQHGHGLFFINIHFSNPLKVYKPSILLSVISIQSFITKPQLLIMIQSISEIYGSHMSFNNLVVKALAL